MTLRSVSLFLALFGFLGIVALAGGPRPDGASVARERFQSIPARLLPITGDDRAKLITRENADDMYLEFRLGPTEADGWGELKVFTDFAEQKQFAVTLNFCGGGECRGKVVMFEWEDGKWVDATEKRVPAFPATTGAEAALTMTIQPTEPVIEYVTGRKSFSRKDGAAVRKIGFDGEKFFIQ